MAIDLFADLNKPDFELHSQLKTPRELPDLRQTVNLYEHSGAA